MIAYVFWHWRKVALPANEYEARQRKFHAALGTNPPAGFLGSFSAGLVGTPWIPGGVEAYEDWYLVENFGALSSLNEGAVSDSRSKPHDAAAEAADGGTGGVYALRQGSVLQKPKYSYWFGKPVGVSYKEYFDKLAPIVEQSGGALWMRQMTLGPARESCLHTERPLSLPSSFDALVIPLREIWAGSA